MPIQDNTIDNVMVSPYWLKFLALRLFVETIPIYTAVTSGNGNIEFYRETTRSTPDRHNAIQNLNYCLLPDPSLFSLPSTFNAASAIREVALKRRDSSVPSKRA